MCLECYITSLSKNNVALMNIGHAYATKCKFRIKKINNVHLVGVS